MKLVISFYLTLIFCGCSFAKQDIGLINNFISEVILNENTSFDETKEYINYGNIQPEQEQKVAAIFKENSKYFKDKLAKEAPYLIITHQESVMRGLNVNFKCIDCKKVYHVIGKNNTLITTFVLEDNKILSFSYNLIKNPTKPKTPFIWRDLINLELN